MPDFKYIAQDDNSKKIRGQISASDVNDLEAKLMKRRLFLIDFEELTFQETSAVKGGFFGPRVPAKEKANFFKILQVFIEAGVSVNAALAESYDAIKHPGMKIVISNLRSAVEESGETFAGALALYPRIFDAMVVESVRMGEESGTLPEILAGQGARLEKEAALRSKLMIQSINPIITIISVVALMIFLNVAFIPKLMESFKEFLPQGNLPPKTAVIMAINGFLMDYGLLFPVAIILGVIGWFLADTKPSAKFIKDKFKFSIPVLKDFILYAELSRITEGIQIGSNSGLPVTYVLQFLERNVSNSVVGQKLRGIRADVGAGMTLAQACQQNSLDHLFNSMISTGEKTGDIPRVMKTAASYYNEKLESMISVVSIVSGILILLIMGVIVGFAMLSAMVPMYELPTVLT